MFTYFFAKATRKGYLAPSYRRVAEKAYQGLLQQFVLVHPDGRISVTQQCLVGGLGFCSACQRSTRCSSARG